MILAQENKKVAVSATVLFLFGGVLGYFLASIVLSIWHKSWSVGTLFLIDNYASLYRLHYT